MKSLLDYSTRDQNGLIDFHKVPDSSGIDIPQVGMTHFRIPLRFELSDGSVILRDVEASMFCSLQRGKTGVNMGRFCSILQEESAGKTVDDGFFKDVLFRFKKDLRDDVNEDPLKNTFLKLKFSHSIKQKSLKSGKWGWQYYPCQWEGHANPQNHCIMSLTLHYEYSSTCPCSLSLARQYEEEFRMGKTTQGSGIAVPHAQRSRAICRVTYDNGTSFTIEELIHLLRTCLPTETQSMAKRIDEQAFAILNGENPMFVEHAARRLSQALDRDERLLDWNASLEHFESLHSHNATAFIRKVHP